MVVCDFCGKNNFEVKRIIMPDKGGYRCAICNECVVACTEFLAGLDVKKAEKEE